MPPMSRWSLRAAAATAALVVTAGCGAGGPSPETVAWVDGVCSAMRPFAEHIAAGPQVDAAAAVGATDAGAALTGLGAFLDGGVTALDETLSGLAAVGPSPAGGGDAVVDRMEAEYTGQQEALRTASTQLATVDATNEAALATALPAALEGLPPTFDPTAELRGDPALAPAVDQSAVCRGLPTTS